VDRKERAAAKLSNVNSLIGVALKEGEKVRSNQIERRQDDPSLIVADSRVIIRANSKCS